MNFFVSVVYLSAHMYVYSFCTGRLQVGEERKKWGMREKRAKSHRTSPDEIFTNFSRKKWWSGLEP